MGRKKLKSSASVLGIVFGGLNTYFYNLDTFLKYLAFPVLGTFLGIFLLFGVNYFFITNLEKIQSASPILENPAVFLILLLILTIPGFAVFLKAFYDYLIAFGALNSMCVIGPNHRIEDVSTHKKIIKQRLLPYCVLLIVLSVIFGTIILIIPALIFLSLAVQVFTLEEDSSPFEAICKSAIIVKENFWKVLWVLIFITIISYWFFPAMLSWAVAKTPVFVLLTSPVEKYLTLLPIEEINSVLAATQISYKLDIVIMAEDIVNTAISAIVIMFMLPFRCACCVDLYKNFGNNLPQEQPTDEQNEKKTGGKRYKLKRG